MKSLRAACAAAIFLGVSVSAPHAWADSTAADKLFDEGMAAMKRNDFPVACEAFEKSNKADASPGTQINLAICFEKQKKWASAWTWYRSAAGLAHERAQATREENATAAVKRLEPQLHHVVIVVKNQPDNGMIVKRDSVEIVTTLAGKDIALPFDPGEHTIEVGGPGRKTSSKKVTIADTPALSTAPETIELTLENGDPPLDTSGPGGPGGRTTIIRTEESGSGKTIGLIVGGGGILMGLAAVGLYIFANGEADERDKLKKEFDATPNITDTDKQKRESLARSVNSHNSAANANQLISIFLAGGAIVTVGIGTVLFLTSGSKSKEKTSHTKILPMPIAGPGFGGMGLTGTF